MTEGHASVACGVETLTSVTCGCGTVHFSLLYLQTEEPVVMLLLFADELTQMLVNL